MSFTVSGNVTADLSHRPAEDGSANTLQHEHFAALTDQRVHSLIARAQSQIELVQVRGSFLCGLLTVPLRQGWKEEIVVGLPQWESVTPLNAERVMLFAAGSGTAFEWEQ